MTSRTSQTLYTQFGGNIRRLLHCASVVKKPVIVAHRGGFGPGFPENSMAAINRSLAQAPLIIEVDVVTSSDGVDFLHHDTMLDRTTTGSGPLKDYTWSQISELLMRDNSSQVTRYSLTRFEEFLASISGRSFVMLDLKSPSDTGELVQRVQKAGMIEATIFIAYNHAQAREIRDSEPRALIAIGGERQEQFDAAKEAGLLGDTLVALTGAIDERSEAVAAFKDAGHYILAGTYFGQNPPDARLTTDVTVPEFENAGRMGVSMLVSNRPIMAVSYLRQRGAYLTGGDCEVGV